MWRVEGNSSEHRSGIERELFPTHTRPKWAGQCKKALEVKAGARRKKGRETFAGREDVRGGRGRIVAIDGYKYSAPQMVGRFQVLCLMLRFSSHSGLAPCMQILVWDCPSSGPPSAANEVTCTPDQTRPEGPSFRRGGSVLKSRPGRVNLLDGSRNPAKIGRPSLHSLPPPDAGTPRTPSTKEIKKVVSQMIYHFRPRYPFPRRHSTRLPPTWDGAIDGRGSVELPLH
jgi:hypothetical protein